MKGININDRDTPFTELILNLVKLVETRERNTLKSLVGQRVGIIRTGRGKAMLVGYVTIKDVIVYETVEAFRADEARHKVKAGSKYDIKPNGKKYGYVLEKPVRCEPTLVTTTGGNRSFRNI